MQDVEFVFAFVFDFFICKQMWHSRCFVSYFSFVATFLTNWVLCFFFSDQFTSMHFVSFIDFSRASDHAYIVFRYRRLCRHRHTRHCHSNRYFRLTVRTLQSFYCTFFSFTQYLRHDTSFLSYCSFNCYSNFRSTTFFSFF